MNEFVTQAAASSRPITSTRILAMAHRPHDLSAGRSEPSRDLPDGSAIIWPSWTRRRAPPAIISSTSRSPIGSSASWSPVSEPQAWSTEKHGAMAPGGDRKAVRPRPRLGQGAQRRDPEDAERAPDLSDRSFPRQGNGPEHHGPAFRQRPVRADLESRRISTMSRSRPRRRSASSGAANSTRRPARCATWCPTTCSSCWR